MPRYEFVEGGSSKFWEITLDGASFTTCWGRIGTAGQSTTKSFASPAVAKKEHDKLVAEKVKKGYSLAGGGAAKPPKVAKPAKPAKLKPIRADVSVENDSGGFSFLSAGVVERAIADGRSNDRAFVDAHEAILVQLAGDDSFVVRVVAGQPLDEREAGEWIARIRTRLTITGGRFLACGGFDPDVLAQWQEEGDGGGVREVAVPDGEYLATVYTYLHTMTGRVLRHDAWKEKLGKWFRRDHGKSAFPSWVAGECARDPEEDPGHVAKWRKLAASVAKGELEVELDPLDWVGMLVHLEPFEPSAELDAPGDDGWFPYETGLRRPERCPLGVASTAEHADVRGELQDLLPKAPPPPITPVDVLARVNDRVLAKLATPVEHPLAGLVQVYRLAWLATDSADPELRVTLPRGATLAWDEPIEGAALAPVDGGFQIGFEASGAKWAQLRAMREVSARLASLPDGTTLELATAPEPDPEQHRDYGVHRYRGDVRGGKWRIAATYPALDPKLLRDALDFSARVDAGKSVPLLDEAEGARALALAKEDESLFDGNRIVVAKGTIGLEKKDTSLLHFVAQYVFRTRWPQVWPCWVQSEEDRLAEAEANAALARFSEELGEKLAAKAAPTGARSLVFDGKLGRFDEIDLAAERPGEVETLERLETDLAKLGYRPLGDLVCARIPDVLVRGWAKEGGHTWAACLAGVLQTSFDFVTELADGAGLTTTLTEGPGDEPAKKLYRSRYPKLKLTQVGKLHGLHEKRVEKLAREHGAPVTTPCELRALAEAIDRGVAKQLGL